MSKEHLVMYWSYLKYLLEHKKNVGLECLRMRLFIHAITHDLSKFYPSEFIPYAKWFFSKNKNNEQDKSDFEMGWNYHQKRNKHHWNFWVYTNCGSDISVEMHVKYVKQMVADWNGMSRKLGGSTIKYFNENEKSMILHPETKKRLLAQILHNGRLENEQDKVKHKRRWKWMF